MSGRVTTSSDLSPARARRLASRSGAGLGAVFGILFCGLFGVLLPARVAHASPDYPDVIQAELDMPCVPQCTLCHTSNPGRAGTARMDFANALGVLSMRPESIPGALRTLEERTPAVDSDGDGMSDLDELREGRDPNVTGEGDICALDVRYGCGARVEPQSPLSAAGSVAAVLTMLGLGLLARRRRSTP